MSHMDKQKKAQAGASPLRAQAAVEVLAYASFFLLVFVAVVAVFFQMQSQELSRAEHAYAQEIAYEFSDHIHTTFVAGPGFYQVITVPPDLLGKPYNISISRKLPSAIGTTAFVETGFVYVDWQGPTGLSTFSSPAITSSYEAAEDYQKFITINLETGFIVMDTSKGSTINMSNTLDENNNSIIRIEGII